MWTIINGVQLFKNKCSILRTPRLVPFRSVPFRVLSLPPQVELYHAQGNDVGTWSPTWTTPTSRHGHTPNYCLTTVSLLAHQCLVIMTTGQYLDSTWNGWISFYLSGQFVYTKNVGEDTSSNSCRSTKILSTSKYNYCNVLALALFLFVATLRHSLQFNKLKL